MAPTYAICLIDQFMDLTVGKHYYIISKSNTHVKLENDMGEIIQYVITNFKLI